MTRRVLLPVLAVLAIVAAASAPWIVAAYLLSLLTLVAITALLASSVNMLAGEVGLVSMGHAGIAAAAGYGVAWGTTHAYGTPQRLGLGLGLALLVSVVYGLTTMRTNGIVFLMVTLALGVVVFGLAFKLSTVTGGQNGLTGITRPALFAAPQAFYFLSIGVLAVSLLLMRAIARSPFGLMLRGVRDSESRMTSLGYSIAPAKFLGTIFSGFFAGLAGILAVWNSEFISPTAASFDRSAMAVVIVIIGGTGALVGPLLGAGLVLGIEHWVSSYFERWPTLLGAVFIAVVILLPRGIAGVINHAGAGPDVSPARSILRALVPSHASSRDSYSQRKTNG